MSKIAVVFYSGYGHTKVIATTIAQEIAANLIEVSQDGEITEQDWQTLDDADAIILGAPTYLASVPWQFKKFIDATSPRWYSRAWQDKIFAGFTNSASLNGDKQVTLIQLQTVAAQHGGLWVSLGIPPANTKTTQREDINYLGATTGLMVQSPADASADEIPVGDLATAKQFAQRVATVSSRWSSLQRLA